MLTNAISPTVTRLPGETNDPFRSGGPPPLHHVCSHLTIVRRLVDRARRRHDGFIRRHFATFNLGTDLRPSSWHLSADNRAERETSKVIAWLAASLANSANNAEGRTSYIYVS